MGGSFCYNFFEKNFFFFKKKEKKISFFVYVSNLEPFFVLKNNKNKKLLVFNVFYCTKT